MTTSENLTRLCGESIDRFQTSPAREAIQGAVERAAAGDGAGTAAALDLLGEAERFVATAGIGALHPGIAGQTAEVLESVLSASDGKIRWSDFSDGALVEAWATVLLANAGVDLAAKLVCRAYYGSAAQVLARLAERQLEQGQITVATALHGHMHVLAKSERSTTRARIALKEGADAEGLMAAVGDASGDPIVESGGEEVEALADLLDVLAALPSNHPAVLAAVRQVGALCDQFIDYKDRRSHGVSLAVVACCRADAAPPEPEEPQGPAPKSIWDTVVGIFRKPAPPPPPVELEPVSPSWRDHAEALRKFVYRSEAESVADAALGGEFAKKISWTHPPPLDTLEELRSEGRLRRRARGASGHAAIALSNTDSQGVVDALIVAVEEPSSETPELDEQLAWAVASNDADRLVKLIDSTENLYHLHPLWPRIADLDPAVALSVFKAAVERGCAAFEFGIKNDKMQVVETLLPTAATVELETRLLQGALEMREHEEKLGSNNLNQRQKRISVLIRDAATRHVDEPTVALERWKELLPEADRPRLSAAAALLGPLGLTAVEAWCPPADFSLRTGVMTEDEARDLCGALAAAGHIDDAFAFAASYQGDKSQISRPLRASLLAIGAVPLDAKQAKTLKARYKKCPKWGRDNDSQQTWKHDFGRLHLLLDEVDDALKVLKGMKDCRISRRGPAYLALDIAQHLLAHPKQSTGTRVDDLLDVLMGSSVIPQDLAAVVPEVIWTLSLEKRAAALRNLLYDGDACLADAGLAVAWARAGETKKCHLAFRKAVDTCRGGRTRFTVSSWLFRAATQAELAKTDPELFMELCLLFPLGRFPRATRAVRELDASGRILLAEHHTRLPAEEATAMANALGETAARLGEIEVLEHLMRQVADKAAALRRARQVACGLAAHGNTAAAEVVARVTDLRS